MPHKLAGFGYALAGLLVAAAPAIASANPDPFVGTWVLNLEKSKYTPGPMPKSAIVVYSAEGDGLKVVAKTVNAEGKDTGVEFTLTLDGKDSPVTGSPDYDMISSKRVSSNKIEFTRKKGGEVVQTGTMTVSEDGKTRTVITDGKNAAGETIHSEAVYDRK
jgi:hypothetical protein